MCVCAFELCASVNLKMEILSNKWKEEKKNESRKTPTASDHSLSIVYSKNRPMKFQLETWYSCLKPNQLHSDVWFGFCPLFISSLFLFLSFIQFCLPSKSVCSRWIDSILFRIPLQHSPVVDHNVWSIYWMHVSFHHHHHHFKNEHTRNWRELVVGFHFGWW